MGKPTTLGDYIRERRTAKQMTLRELARQVKVSAPFLSDVEHNRRQPSDDTLKRIAAALGCRRASLIKYAGLRRDLIDWIRNNPELESFLRDLKESGPARIGGEDCPCCGRRRHDDAGVRNG